MRGANDVDFDGRNGCWREQPIICIDNQKLRQLIRVKDRNGKVLHVEETPSWLFSGHADGSDPQAISQLREAGLT